MRKALLTAVVAAGFVFGTAEAHVALFGDRADWKDALSEEFLDFTDVAETPRHVEKTIDAKRGCRGKADVCVVSFSRGEAAAIDTLIGFDWAIRFVQSRICEGTVVVPMPAAAPDAAFVNEAMQAFGKRKHVVIAKGHDAASVREALAKVRTVDAQPPSLKETSYNGWCHIRRMTEKRKEILGDAKKAYDIVFFGDSITHGFDWDHEKGYAVVTNRLANYRCLNLGYGADQTQHLLWRGKGGELDGYTAKMFCLMIGTNNGRWGHKPADIAAGVRAILDLVAAKHPESKILLLPVFPRGRQPTDPLRKKNAETSALIAKFADGEKVLWLDFNAKLTEPDGMIAKEMMPDALHPAPPGYEIWFSEMMPVVKRICGEGMGGNWGKPRLDGIAHATVAAEPPPGRPSPLAVRDGVAYLTDENGDTTANLIWRLEHGLLKGLEAKAVVLRTGSANDDPFEDVFCGIVAAARLVEKVGPPNVPVVILPLSARTRDADFINRDLGLENVAQGRVYFDDVSGALRLAAIPACLRTKSPCADPGVMSAVTSSRKGIGATRVCFFGGAADVRKMNLPTNCPVRTVYGCGLSDLLWRARAGDFKGFSADKVFFSLPQLGRGDRTEDVLAGLDEIIRLTRRDQSTAKLVFVTYAGNDRFNEAMKAFCGENNIDFADLQLKLVHGQWMNSLSDEDNRRLAELCLQTNVALVTLGSSADVIVDASIPAGNAIVESVSNGVVRLRQDMRDSADWFYWAFRVRGAEGRKLDFVFTNPYAGGPVSARGPAVTKDGGRTWSYAAEKTSRPNGFSYAFGKDEHEVWFYQTIQYLPNDWAAFLVRHAVQEGKSFERDVLCKSRKGRDVPCAQFGRLDGRAKFRLLLTSRHHCGEATATRVLEGVCESFLAEDELGVWLRENVEAFVVPFVDYDGVVDGDQGKGRKPHDHNRDYTEFSYPETRAIRDWAAKQARVDFFIDFHCPWVREGSNEYVNQVYGADEKCTERQIAFGKILERQQPNALGYRQADDIPWMTSWNRPSNYTAGRSSTGWGRTALKGCRYSSSLEIPFSKAHDKTVDCALLRAFGHDVARAMREYLKTP